MNVEEIKQRIVSLSGDEQNELSAFLFHLRHRGDPADIQKAEERLADRDPSHWLTIDEFERRLV